MTKLYCTQIPPRDHDLLSRGDGFGLVAKDSVRSVSDLKHPDAVASRLILDIRLIRNALQKGSRELRTEDYAVLLSGFGDFAMPMSCHPSDNGVLFCEEGRQFWRDWSCGFLSRLDHLLFVEGLPAPCMLLTDSKNRPNVLSKDGTWLDVDRKKDEYFSEVIYERKDKSAVTLRCVDKEIGLSRNPNLTLRSGSNIFLYEQLLSLAEECHSFNLSETMGETLRSFLPDVRYGNRGSIARGGLLRTAADLFVSPPESPPFDLLMPDISPLSDIETGPTQTIEGWAERFKTNTSTSQRTNFENTMGSFAAASILGLRKHTDRTEIVPWLTYSHTEPYMGMTLSDRPRGIRPPMLGRYLGIMRESELQRAILDPPPCMQRKYWTSLLTML